MHFKILLRRPLKDHHQQLKMRLDQAFFPLFFFSSLYRVLILLCSFILSNIEHEVCSSEENVGFLLSC